MAMNKSEVFVTGFTKLNGTNYHNWCFQMEMALIRDGLWEATNGVKAAFETDATYTAKVARARAAIVLAVEESELIHIRRPQTAKEIWEALKKVHQRTSLTNKVGTAFSAPIYVL